MFCAPAACRAAGDRLLRVERLLWAAAAKAGRQHDGDPRVVGACPPADGGTVMAEVLAQLIAARRPGLTRAREVPLGGLAWVLRALGGLDAAPGLGRSAGGAAAGLPALVEPLSRREMQVLRLLATRSTNQGVARDPVVTLDTVQKPVGHVLAKLGAADRTEAVTRARRLGLIS
jgi:LuxR family maltose regulon positive regulatory protein